MPRNPPLPVKSADLKYWSPDEIQYCCRDMSSEEIETLNPLMFVKILTPKMKEQMSPLDREIRKRLQYQAGKFRRENIQAKENKN
jgi:hypothetical protein